MEMMPIKPERKAQLEAFAAQHGQDAATLLDDALADYLARQESEYQEALQGIRRGYADMQAGRLLSVEEVFDRLRVKHDLPG